MDISPKSYKPLEPKDFKGSFKGDYKVPVKGFGMIEAGFELLL